jgi:hypothetical protein
MVLKKGIYVLEEHFDKRLIENNKLKEGLLFTGTFPEIKLYNKKKIFENEKLNKHVKNLKRNWDLFLLGEIQPEKIFNLDKMAKYYAISDLLQGNHTHYLANEKYYLNPTTSLIEPIGREWESLRHSDKSRNRKMFIFIEVYDKKYAPYFHRKFFENEIFLKKYINELNKISNKEYLDDFFKLINNQKNEKLSYIYKDNPAYSYPTLMLYKNQKYIKEKINPKTPCISVFLEKVDDNGCELSLENLQEIPIEIINVKIDNIVIFESAKNKLILPSLRDKEKQQISFGKFKKIFQKEIKKINLDDLEVHYKMLGTKKIRKINVFPFSREQQQYFGIKKYSDLIKEKFLEIKLDDKTCTFKSKKILITKNLIIPPGFKVIFNDGITIDIINNAKIISYSPIKCVGLKKGTIKFISTDKTGQGITIFKSKENLFKNVDFIGLSNPVEKGWNLSGALNIYESTIKFENCNFSKNYSGDDMLNIIRSEFKIINCKFENVLSDAFDSDFSNGEMIDVNFKFIGNDAIDVSGSNIIIKNINILEVGDKGISAGEKSFIKANNIEIQNTEIAVSSKDLSEIKINRLKIKKCKIGFALFNKKPEFGPGKAFVENIESENIEIFHMVEKESELFLENKNIKGELENVESKLYGVEYGKSSK